MANTATVTRKLKAEGLPVELVRGEGYHYYIFDRGETYECWSVYVPHFGSYAGTKWEQMGRDFAAAVEAGTHTANSQY